MANNSFDVIIVGGSYSGLAAAMSLGRALRNVLIIDHGKPCNRQTPQSHNFITHDGKAPKEIAMLARKQLEKYATVKFLNANATTAERSNGRFDISIETGEIYSAKKLIFATGIRDLMPSIAGFSECWGISVLHCPYCHGYEVRDAKTGILANGDFGFEFCVLISNWTKDLTLFTNGTSTLSPEQKERLRSHNIRIVEDEIEKLEHEAGQINCIVFKNGITAAVTALYTKTPFEQHCRIPGDLGCEIDEEGFIKVDHLQRTSIPGIVACGDNTNRMRTVANAVATGTTAGMMLNKDMVMEEFLTMAAFA